MEENKIEKGMENVKDETEVKSDYEINPLTIAIIAMKVNGHYHSKVIEASEESIQHIKRSPRKIMDLGCKYFGSSLQGRQEGARDVCGIQNKVPISVDPSSGMYFFPTASPQNPYCSWISHTYIDRIRKAPGRGTEFVFKDGSVIILEVSYGSMINQLQRTAQFRYLLDKRIHFTTMKKKNKDTKETEEEDFFLFT
ncbi:competence protein [Paraliobacillus quinghaiensis]|uniref:Competence protein n=1 Tax=Paraliobacillus quinghaiensis TaxID=470815 RepID=A0A917TK59_9BACI|nr:competence protein ComK [Paraliobacillus quinghaiensis]GGM25207.1 competence protein [Paraliobacillus quinghaiensis]